MAHLIAPEPALVMGDVDSQSARITRPKLDGEPLEVRRRVAELLNEISRPMTVRELDEAFRVVGFTRSQRRPFIRALKGIAVIAVAPAS